MTTEKLCDCQHPHYARGLCQICYQYALDMIGRGETSWKQLEEAGKARPLIRKKRQVYFKGESHE